jgi:eukaryotic-like serine/threonine-protein kinase
MDRLPGREGRSAKIEETLGLARLKSSLFGDEVPPPRLGRYTVRRRIGSGAAGSVFAATDPELERDVAIKLVLDPPSSPSDPLDHRRLLREARALAKLSHPNIVPIYDVGTWRDPDDGRETPFIVMELVEGQTLAQWLASERRSWSEIVALFEGCARGLLAAHEAGLVHRDFKPSNVLVGRDGRPRVADFGLARRTRRSPAIPGPPVEGALAIDPARPSVTHGGISGTPAYMAPEQLGGAPATPKSDQYAFCVALYEALHGELPFSAPNLRRLALDKADGPGRWPTRGPWGLGRLEPVVLRGLSPEPDDRFDSMHELLAALRAVRTRRTLRRAMALVGIAGVFVLGWASGFGEDPAPCVPSGVLVDELWSDARRNALRDAFAATGAPHAERSWSRVHAEVDGFLESWARARDDACARLSAADSGSESEARSTTRRRILCLDGQLDQVAALLDVWQQVDAEAIERTERVGELLPGLDACDPWAVDATPPDPALLAARRDLTLANALRVAGRCPEAADLARRAGAQLEPTAHARARVDLRMVEAFSVRCLGDPARAIALLTDAMKTAEQAGDATRAARAWIHLARLEAVGRSDLRAADLALEMARVKMDTGDAGPRLRLAYLQARAVVRHEQGRFDDAVAANREALALLDDEPTAHELERAEILHELGLGFVRQDRLDDAHAAFEEARSIWARTIGPEHPTYAAPLANLAWVAERRGAVDEALALLDQADAILRGAEGREVRVAEIAVMRAHVLQGDGRASEAVDLLRDARPRLLRAYGPEHVAVARLDTNLGEALTRTGDAAAGLETASRAMEVFARIAPDHADLAHTRVVRAAALVELGRGEEAVAELDAAGSLPLAELEVDALRVRARATALAERWDEATALLEDAVAIARRARLPPATVARIEADLASVPRPR